MQKLPREFFLQNTDEVAQQLLGKMILITNNKKIFKAIITETESYHGDDPASHASRKRTPRNEPMFWHGGYLYVYLIYGMYFCLNITTENADYPAAVLIRGVKVISPSIKILNGPGKLCRDLLIDKTFDRLDICGAKVSKKFSCYDIGLKPKFTALSRIGISQNKNALLRFLVREDVESDEAL
jgi:DNA-3-methyladenine glycosylase